MRDGQAYRDMIGHEASRDLAVGSCDEWLRWLRRQEGDGRVMGMEMVS